MKKCYWLLILVFIFTPINLTATDKAKSDKDNIKRPHPHHQLIVWTTTYQKTIFRVIKLPRCQHLETIITYNPPGETKEQAKKRMEGIAVCTANFYNTQTLKPVDYFRRYGIEITGKEVGRPYLAIYNDGWLEVSDNYQYIRKNPKIDALALGQLLVPFNFNGFSIFFANIETDRMALAFSKNYFYIVQGKSNLWRLSKFIKVKLYCDLAINTDGGHAVKGYSPFHLVFRWKKAN